MSASRRMLAAFDMDNTINTRFLQSSVFQKISPMVRSKYIEGSRPWQQRVMNAMSKHSYTLSQVTSHISQIGIIPGMKSLFKNLNSKGVDLIILSGGNDLMVKIYLEQQGLTEYFSGIIANRMQESAGQLMYRPVSKINPCVPYCRSLLCKRFYLSDYVKGKGYDKVFMVGDGDNDYCAFSWIKKGKGAAMIKGSSEITDSFRKNKGMREGIECDVYEWRDGEELNEQFEKAIEG